MALDIKFEVFAHNIFQKIWFTNGLTDKVVKCCEAYKGLDHHFEFEFHSAYQAIASRMMIFRRLNIKRAKADYRKYSESVSDFSNYIKDVFLEAEYDDLPVFDHCLQTMAYVAEIALYSQHFWNNDIFIDHAHLCWAFYFDSSVKDDFYEVGGWEEFQFICKDYKGVWDFLQGNVPLKYWRMGRLLFPVRHIMFSITDLADFFADVKQNADSNFLSLGMRWVPFHIKGRKIRWKDNCNRPPMLSAIPEDRAYLELLITSLILACDTDGPGIVNDSYGYEMDDSLLERELKLPKNYKKVLTGLVSAHGSKIGELNRAVYETFNVIKAFDNKTNSVEHYPKSKYAESEASTSGERQVSRSVARKFLDDIYDSECDYEELTTKLNNAFIKDELLGELKETLALGPPSSSSDENEDTRILYNAAKLSSQIGFLETEVRKSEAMLSEFRKELGDLGNGNPIQSVYKLMSQKVDILGKVGPAKYARIVRLFQECAAQSSIAAGSLELFKQDCRLHPRTGDLEKAFRAAKSFKRAVRAYEKLQLTEDSIPSSETASIEDTSNASFPDDDSDKRSLSGQIDIGPPSPKTEMPEKQGKPEVQNPSHASMKTGTSKNRKKRAKKKSNAKFTAPICSEEKDDLSREMRNLDIDTEAARCDDSALKPRTSFAISGDSVPQLGISLAADGVSVSQPDVSFTVEQTNTKSPTAKKKRKKRKPTSKLDSASNKPIPEGSTPQTSNNDPPDVLRMILVLGDRKGMDFVTSTLPKT